MSVRQYLKYVSTHRIFTVFGVLTYIITRSEGEIRNEQSKVSKGAKIRNRYNQVPHLTQETNEKVTNLQLDTTNESQEVSPFIFLAFR